MAKKKGNPPAPRPRHLADSITAVAKFVGRSRDVVQRDWRPHWPSDCTIGRGKQTKYDLAKITQWALSRQQSPNDAVAEHTKRKRELENERLSLQLAEARRREHVASGLLIDRLAAERDMQAALRGLRDAFLRMPTKLIPLWGENGPYVADQLRRHIEAALCECVDRLRQDGGYSDPIT